MKYLIVIEKANDNYSAYLPDISGCIATGKTIEDTKKNIAEALSMHLRGMEEDGLPSPGPKAKADYIKI
ncbi:MAG: type II toxin-antitoxin system HicB family antitoxin [Actinobacteria bacterium]|nr:type II toxin-antitoxin system HicB family antitoxin [Cyanobacteriota bacterium]MCL5771842.1 type II toxin-antitoxin system HicB family antitoxin [Actinomycetota bacterium]